MAKPIADDAFIIISGNPKKGRKERISRVRAHITKDYFRRIHHRAEAGQIKADQKHTSSCNGTNPSHGSRNVGHRPTRNELCNPMPIISSALLDQSSSFAAETTRRMQKFFDLHLLGVENSHPFFINVVQWAIHDPHFTSAKLLNASGWDDILETGQLTLWTTRQRFITMRLLNDTITSEPRVKGEHATVAAVQSLLGFELLIGNDQNINRLQNFHDSLITQYIQLNDDIWSFLIRGHLLLNYADRLRRRQPKQITYPQPYLNYRLAFPVDLSLFTFNQASAVAKDQRVCVLLYDLCQILSIAGNCQTALLRPSTLECIVSQHEKSLSYISDLNPVDPDYPSPVSGISSLDDNYHCIASLQLSIFILTSCLISSCDKETGTKRLAELASRLRALLSSGVNELYGSANWMAFPGALMWCHAIGLRFADLQRDRTGFLMQFLRLSKMAVLETWEEASKSMEVIVYGLERIGPLIVEPSEDEFPNLSPD